MSLTIGLVNNAAGRALASTERQFRAVLQAAPLRTLPQLNLYRSASLLDGEPPRGLCGQPYARLADLLHPAAEGQAVDAILVTGMQPGKTRLQDEPIWPDLAELADWAEQRAVPVLWSCLAAHAAMLHLDGIGRSRLPSKLSGLFVCEAAEHGHELVEGLPSSWLTPHSRYNGVDEDRLADHGYEVLSRSAEAGPDALLRHGSALSLLLQGHPEYEADTLLKEYRRDLRKFFGGMLVELPAIPAHYFDAGTEQALATLSTDPSCQRREPALLAQILARTERATYRSAQPFLAGRLLANWLHAALRPSEPVIWPHGEAGAYLPALHPAEPGLAHGAWLP